MVGDLRRSKEMENWLKVSNFKAALQFLMRKVIFVRLLTHLRASFLRLI
jgi:hypothetical protein